MDATIYSRAVSNISLLVYFPEEQPEAFLKSNRWEYKNSKRPPCGRIEGQKPPPYSRQHNQTNKPQQCTAFTN